jgi:hypothetical protein
MDELSRALLHGTAGLDAAEDAMSGNLGAALREQAISEWAGQPEPEHPAYRARRGRTATWGPSESSRPPEITRRSQVLAFVVIGLVILILILVAVG